MADCSREALSRQVQSICEQGEAADGLPLRDLLSPEKLQAVLQRYGVTFRERVYTPMVTLWAFLSQVTARNNASCEDAVCRVLVDRLAQGKPACSPETGSYCEARKRLPEAVISDLVRETGQELHRQASPEWLWKERRVVIVDGSTATMADTPANQESYPQTASQKPGLGFPVLRFVVLLSLATGAVLECAIGACRGKLTGEQSLFRRMWEALQPGDILLGDCLYDCYRDIALLKARGNDVLFGKKQSRRSDFRRGRRLGPGDHIVVWKRPKYDSTRYENRQEWEALPAELAMRETRITVRRRGYRTRQVIVVSTLLDAERYAARDLTDLFAERWHCELDLRSIKQSLGLQHLQCKSPAMVRKELWTTLLAYNLIRVRMAQAAAVHGLLPRRLSFSSALKLVHNFAPQLALAAGSAQLHLERELIRAIARQQLPERPGRQEPRAVKKRKQKYPYLKEPRPKARKQLTA